MLHAIVLALIALGFFASVVVPKAFPFDLSQDVSIQGLSLPGAGALPPQEPILASNIVPSTIHREDLVASIKATLSQAPKDAAGAAGDPTATATDAPEPEEPYQLYIVQDGDTASAIAARFGITLEYLLWNNPDLRDGEFLEVGQTIIIPPGNGVLHFVRYGETLSDIATRYGVALEDILDWPGNNVTDANSVVEDQIVFVPGGIPPVAVLPDPTPAPTQAQQPPQATPQPTPQPPPPPPTSGSGLIWPVTGPISSYMDASHPLGIDIDLYNNPSAPIAAATSGTVIFAGGNACCSYGLYVVVLSPDGIETLYAHFSSISVSAGQQVSQGQTLGIAGCTGYCTGNHLHFEVIDNGVRVNPLDYLP